MQRYFPNDPRFNAQNFGFQPPSVIYSAITWGSKFKREDLHAQEVGLALLTSIFVNSKRDPKKSKPVRPKDFWHFTPEDDRVSIDPVACDAFLILAQRETLPAWALAIAPLDQIRGNRQEGSIDEPVILVSDELLLIQPEIVGDRVSAPLAFINSQESEIEVSDPSDEDVSITVAIAQPGVMWCVDFEGKLI